MNSFLCRLNGTAIVILLLANGGCGGNSKKAAMEQSNLKPLVIFYGQFVGQHRGQAPASEEEFKSFVEAMGPDALKPFGVTDVNSLFSSPRDHQPYVILYGQSSATPGVGGPAGPAGPGGPGVSGGGSPGLGGQPVVAYEATGVGGKRLVGSSLGAIEEVDEKRFRELVPTAK